ncbi:MAG: WecB/TagA/CpsF family glycosyltransferase [Clostridia bacterium]|nr:WecB/TagA/CpsF family glycosyltransferase [Clostridia bacterium]
MEEIKLYGVKIDNVTMGQAVHRALLSAGEPCVVFTPNALMLERARRDAELAKLLCRASISLPDGRGVLWAAQKMGTPLCERVAGIDFGAEVLGRAERAGLRVFLLGGGEGVAERAAQNLRKKHPRLCICGTTWGYFQRTGEENMRTVSYIRACRPDILFVCMGFPVQEEWVMENLHLLSDVRLIACLGGSLDVWAGDLRRAPVWLSRAGLEWLWRMLCQPKRFANLPHILSFLWHVPQKEEFTERNPL